MSLKSKIFLFAFLLSTSARIFSQDFQTTQVLCVDVGGTRIKAAVLPSEVTLEDLRHLSTIEFDSKEWLNENIPQLFDPKNPNNIYEKVGLPHDELSIGIRGPVMDGAYCVVPKERFPREMKLLCEKASGCPVSLECDTGIWARGALYWQELIKEEVAYPCLGFTLGTGIGVALLVSPEEIINIEISVIDKPFNRLLALAEDQPLKQDYGRPATHDVIGMPYFQWVKQKGDDVDSPKIAREFNERILAFIEDMEDYISVRFQKRVRSIMIGGGNSRFVDAHSLKEKLERPILLLSPANVGKYGVAFDAISLLGCLKIRTNPSVKMDPTWEEMLPWYVSSP